MCQPRPPLWARARLVVIAGRKQIMLVCGWFLCVDKWLSPNKTSKKYSKLWQLVMALYSGGCADWIEQGRVHHPFSDKDVEIRHFQWFSPRFLTWLWTCISCYFKVTNKHNINFLVWMHGGFRMEEQFQCLGLGACWSRISSNFQIVNQKTLETASRSVKWFDAHHWSVNTAQ